MSILISIVIPIFNEEGNILPLLNSIQHACQGLKFELIAINDGSTDGTLKELKMFSSKNSCLRIINFKRNFGQTAALAAGIDFSQGDVIIPIDGDGQNDPADIPGLISKLDEGFDVVSGWRMNRKDFYLSRKLPSWMANKLISYVTGVRLHDYGCTLKAYRRNMIKDVDLYGDMHRFLPAWCAWQGGKISEIPVRHHPRIRGKSKYGLFRIFKVIIDLMTLKFFSGYLSKPGHLFSGTGLVFIFMGMLSASVAIVDKFGFDKFPEYRIPLLLLAIFFGLASIFLILMSFLAELLIRLYFRANQQKSYRLADE